MFLLLFCFVGVHYLHLWLKCALRLREELIHLIAPVSVIARQRWRRQLLVNYRRFLERKWRRHECILGFTIIIFVWINESYCLWLLFVCHYWLLHQSIIIQNRFWLIIVNWFIFVIVCVLLIIIAPLVILLFLGILLLLLQSFKSCFFFFSSPLQFFCLTLLLLSQLLIPGFTQKAKVHCLCYVFYWTTVHLSCPGAA